MRRINQVIVQRTPVEVRCSSNRAIDRRTRNEGKIFNPETKRWIKDTARNRNKLNRAAKLFNPVTNRYIIDTPANRKKIAKIEYESESTRTCSTLVTCLTFMKKRT
jgi:hypothetical protein